MATTFTDLDPEFRFDLSGDRQVSIAGFDNIDEEAEALENLLDRIDEMDARLNLTLHDISGADFSKLKPQDISQLMAEAFRETGIELREDSLKLGHTDAQAPNANEGIGRGGGGTELG